jgi:hypothetical protein
MTAPLPGGFSAKSAIPLGGPLGLGHEMMAYSFAGRPAAT